MYQEKNSSVMQIFSADTKNKTVGAQCGKALFLHVPVFNDRESFPW